MRTYSRWARCTIPSLNTLKITSTTQGGCMGIIHPSKVPKPPLKMAVFTLSKMRVKSSAHLSSMTTPKGTIQ